VIKQKGGVNLEESLFIKELGIKSPMLKILDFLMDNESFDYSKTDIAEGAELSRATLSRAWPQLESLGLVKATRTVGQAKMFKIDRQNPVVKKLIELDDAISEYFAQKSCGEDPRSNFSEILEHNNEMIKAIVEYESGVSDDKRDRREELLLA
jgi:DNA-binding transcriptional ArsR family regulator